MEISNREHTKITDKLKISKQAYLDERAEEQKVINFIMHVGSKGRGELTLGSVKEDLLGIDAKGIQRNKTVDDTNLLIQLKSDSGLRLPSIKQTIYLRKVSEEMTKLDPTASQRLIVYRRTGKKIRLGNYSIIKLIDDPINNRQKKTKKKD